MDRRKLKIAFMGTPDFAVPSLEQLIRSHYEVKVVVSVPDRPAGRGQKLKASAVKEAALKHEIQVLQPEQLDDPFFLDQLKSMEINLIVVVAFRKLPAALWQLPIYGTFNLHGSLLPDYRGAAPLNWAVINGETQSGVTTFFIDEKIDTGAIIDSEVISIHFNDTVGELHDQLMRIGANLVLKTVDSIAAGTVKVQDQAALLQGRVPKKAPKIFKETCRIAWTGSALEIHNLIRGLSPYPGAFSTLIKAGQESLQLKIFRSLVVEDRSEKNKLQVGEIKIAEDRIFVGTGAGVLELLELQLQGKKKIKTPDFIRGFSLNNYCFS